MLTSWLHTTGLSQVKHLRHIALPVADEYPEEDPDERMEPSHPALIEIRFGPEGKHFSAAKIEIHTDTA
jgi:hypothetical protein